MSDTRTHASEPSAVLGELALPHVPREWFVRPNGHDASGSIHGVAHTVRVWVHAQELAGELSRDIADDLGPLSGWELEALNFSALWHDIGRTNDATDYYHGAKSAGKVAGLALHSGLDALMLEVALNAVTHHCGSEAHAERSMSRLHDPSRALRVFRILKDADALDRVRLGAGDLDTGQLRFQQSRRRVERAWELLRLIPDQG